MNSALMLHRHARPAVAGSYLVGAIAGALGTGLALLVASGLLSPIPDAGRRGLAGSILALLALHAIGLVCLRLPQRARQIDREVFSQDPSRAAFRFALELGTGLRTYVTSAAPYAVVTVLLLAPVANTASAIANAACAAVGFGIGRSLIVVGHALSSRVAVDHPPIWYRIATGISILSAAIALAELSSIT